MKPKSTLCSLLALAGGSLLSISSASAQATSATWDQNSDGNWTDPLNWTGDTNYAGGIDNTATFGNFINANRVITLDADITIGNITASDTSNNYTISALTSQILTLDRSTGIPEIDVTTSGRTLTINTQISGADGLQKSGAGTLQLSSTANNYTGGTTINAGTLSVATDANLGDTSGGITLNGGTLQLGNTVQATSRSVTLNNTAGNQIAIGGNGNWTFNGAFTGDGGVNFVGIPNGNVSATLTNTSNTFKGALGISASSGGNTTVNIRSLADSAEANGNIIFGGNNTNTQTFEWSTAAASGLTLDYRSIELTGNANNTSVIRNNNTTQVLTINTDLVYTTGTGAKTLALDITGAGAGIVINGDISDGTGGGTVALQKMNNGGPLSLLGNNSYTGQTQLLNGTTTVNTLADFGSNSSIGRGTNGVALLFAVNGSTGTLNYIGGTTSSNRTIQINSANNNNGGGATINNNGAGKLTFTAATFNQTYSTATAATRGLTLGGSNDGEIQGMIQDSNSFVLTSLTKTGTGTWTLSGDSSGTTGYTGATTVSGGTLNVTGQLKSNVTVANNAFLSGSGTTTGTLSLNSGSTILGTTTGSSFQAQSIAVTSGAKIAGSDGSGTIGSHTIGVVRYSTGTGPTTANFNLTTSGYRSASLANVGGAGGETQLTYTNAARTWNSASGTWDVMTSNTWQEGDFKFSQGDAITFDDSGTGGGSARTVTLNTLVTPGSVTFNNSTSAYTVSGIGTIAGLTSLTKSGTETLTLSNNNTYTGATNVSGGKLVVNGSIAYSSLTTVASGATLGGSGRVGALTISTGGFVTPGNSPGILTVEGNYIQQGTYTAEIDGTTPGTGHDQINVFGTVNITGGSLVAMFGGGTYTANDLIFILLNDSTDAIIGTYNGLAQGATVTSYGGFNWQISYTANNTGVGTGTFTGGNDIALQAVLIPEPKALLLGALGVLLLLRRRR